MNILVNTIHEPGRLHEVILEDQDYIIRIFNVNGYNSELLKLQFIAKLQNAIQVNKMCVFTCIGGDFNIVLSNSLDKEGGNNRKTASQVYLNNTISQNNLIDT